MSTPSEEGGYSGTTLWYNTSRQAANISQLNALPSW